MGILRKRAGNRRWLGVVPLLVTLLLVALGGSVTSGRAASGNPVSWTFTVLNDVSATIPGQPTPGGNIGYELKGVADGGNSVNHLILTETIGPAGTVVYVNSSGTQALDCSGSNTATLSCSVSQLRAGTTFDVVVLFKTDPAATPGSDVTNTVFGSFDPQTPNKTNNRNTDTFGPAAPVVRQYAGLGDGSLTQSLTLGNDSLAAGGPESSSVKLPSSFRNGFDYVGVTLQNRGGITPPAGCPSTCQQFDTQTTIPPAAVFGSTGPFFDGTTAAGYQWSFTIPVANTFKPTGVFHTDDSNANGQILPACSVAGGQPVAPTTAPGLCVSSVTLDKKSNPHRATYAGLGVANGHGYGF